MRHDQAEHARVQGLLDDPLVALTRVRRDTDKRDNLRLESTFCDNPLAVKQKLQREAETRQVKAFVLHFKDDEVIAHIGKSHGLVDVPCPRHAPAKNHFPLFQQLNDLV